MAGKKPAGIEAKGYPDEVEALEARKRELEARKKEFEGLRKKQSERLPNSRQREEQQSAPRQYLTRVMSRPYNFQGLQGTTILSSEDGRKGAVVSWSHMPDGNIPAVCSITDAEEYQYDHPAGDKEVGGGG